MNQIKRAAACRSRNLGGQPRAAGVWLCLAMAVFGLAPARGASGVVRGAGAGWVAAPELNGEAWVNVPKGTNITLASRRGKVTVVHFWTFGCINCKRDLQYYRQWQERFGGRGLQVVGVHTPETAEERDPANVTKKVKELGITYPVLIDEGSQNWKAWQQRCWPTVYLVDKRGRVRFAWEGELEWQGAGGNPKVQGLIEALLKE